MNEDFRDIRFSSSPAKVEVQWRNYSDPESTIQQYDVKVQSAKLVQLYNITFRAKQNNLTEVSDHFFNLKVQIL